MFPLLLILVIFIGETMGVFDRLDQSNIGFKEKLKATRRAGHRQEEKGRNHIRVKAANPQIHGGNGTLDRAPPNSQHRGAELPKSPKN